MINQIYFIAILLTLISSSIACKFSIKISKKYDFVNNPTEARLSFESIPLSGGFCIFLSFILCSFIFFSFSSEIYFLMIFFTGIFIVGLVDDFINLRSLAKFSFPLIIVIIAVINGLQVSIFVHPIFNFLISVFFIYGIVNAFNFIDNSDGISSINAISSYTGISVLSYISEQEEIFLVSSLFLFSALGFLFFNYPDASIYAGDSGSLLFGFSVSTLLLLGSWDNVELAHKNYSFIFFPILAVGYPIFDVTYVFFHRILNNYPPWKGDTNHTSHKLLKLGYTKRQVLHIIAIISFTIVLASILTYYITFLVSIILFALIIIGLCAFTLYLNKIPFELPN